LAAVLAVVGALAMPTASSAQTTEQINADVNATLAKFTEMVPGANAFLRDAQGVLVFPKVVQAGFGVGGELGKGALLIHGQPVGYYSIGAASVGFQFGVQVKNIVIVFLDRRALDNFRAMNGWTVGVNGSVVLVNVGGQAGISSATINQPVVGFVFGQEGLMYNLTLQGTKITPIHPQ